MHPSCRVGLGDYNRSAFMTKEIRFCLNADEAPALPGAYAMAIEFADKVAVTLSGRSLIVLPAVRYLYCGSAKGPGGLKARLSRHVQRGKSVRWYVDQLTEQGLVVGNWIFLGGDDCEVVQMCSYLPMPIAGFGSRVRRRLNNVEHLLAEGAQELLGVGRANAPDHAGREVLLDAVGRGRGRCAQEPRLELLAVCSIVDPFVIHSPAAMVAAWPTTVTTSRCPRALARRTQKPFSTLWYVTRSTSPASTSLSDGLGCVFMMPGA